MQNAAIYIVSKWIGATISHSLKVYQLANVFSSHDVTFLCF